VITNGISRRKFMGAGLTAGAGFLLLPSGVLRAADFRTKLYRATIVGEITEQVLRPLKAAGFDGVETTALVDGAQAAAGRKLAEKLGLRIHSVSRGWAEFNSADPAKVASSLAVTEQALRAAQGYGADAILLVPCRIDGMPIPQPWEFKIEFDEQTGHLLKVCDGDNRPYQPYINAHNHATDASRVAVQQLIPLAAQLKVVIALENVWNNLWVTPALYRHFVASFQSAWVRSYFDIGNHVKYRPPQEWIRALGPLIAKLHVKDFKLNPDGHGGQFVHPRDGSINWPEVRRAIDEIGHNGWLTIEDNGLPLPEFRARLDQIIAGV
jgi:hexulose-6-phosphate isomerase